MSKFKNLSEIEKQKIINRYLVDKVSARIIAKEYNSSSGAIIYFLKTHGIKIRDQFLSKNRKYYFNFNYFDIIDSEDKAYFLGLMYADGNNSLKNSVASIGLQEEDGYILQKFIEAIESNYTLKLCKMGNNRKNQYRFTICSKYFCEALLNKGCMVKKSLILKFPTQKQLPKDLIHHFIRGYFDGDGCISFKKRKNTQMLHFNLVGTYDMLKSINDIFIEKLNIYPRKILKTGKVYNLHITRQNDIKKIYKYFYTNTNYFLSRKKVIFEKPIIKNRENYSSEYVNICYRKEKDIWRALYRDINFKRREKIFKTKEEAVIFLKSINQFNLNRLLED